MPVSLRIPLLLVLGALVAAPLAGAATRRPDPDLLAGLAARSIGPATMSGRIAAVTAVRPGAGDPLTVWVGAATGGVWKSVDGGLTWTPVFDDQPVAAIGSVAVSPGEPDVVWVGTGEGNPRNSASVGNGVYRSRDGGETWRHLGLAESERVHRIVVHPDDPETAWACAMGRTWGENDERGVFRTRDGGATWEKVLFVDRRTGCADLAADPGNPDKLFAAMWDHRRWPWSFRSGGPGSGLFVSRDGGGSWRRVTPDDGLPEGDLGRIGLAVAPSRPSTVYAYVEAEENGLYRSTDGGRTWELRTTDPDAGNRPFYYADLRVDPQDPDRVYSLWSLTSVSDDGGATWRRLIPFRAVHPDHHAMWIDPADPRHIIEGNDGGVYESRDRGETWRFVANLPLAQYYHVRVDDEVPYNVYGGLQDNGSWKGPAEVWENGGIRNHHWQEVGFGDGFDTAPVPGETRRGYAMSQEGHVLRWDLDTGERKSIRPAPPAGGEELRFNWNAAFAQDPFDADTIYFGSQVVHRSRDRGDTWETISPDLTTDDPQWQRQAESGGLTLDVTGAENFTTLVALAPSPVEPGVLWAGSDDGRLHVTRDAGATWTSVEGRLRGVPEHTWIPHIEPSPHDAATAFVVFDNHRRSDWTPYAARTDDYGRTWRSLATPQLAGYALAIRQDPVDPDLLFLGTEFGLWVSLDGGGSWLKWTHGVPTVSVMDLAIQPAESDLVIATHGRSLYVLDDLTPLRELEAAHLEAPLHLFSIADTQQHRVAQTGSSRFPGHGEFRGENEPYGALVAFALAGDDLPWADDERERERQAARREAERGAADEEEAAVRREEGGERAVLGAAAGEAEPEEEEAEEEEGRKDAAKGPQAILEVRDAGGALVRKLEVPVHRGVNRVAWDLRHDAFDEPESDVESFREPSGPEVVPGDYTVKVLFGEHEATAPVRVVADPRSSIPAEARAARHAAEMRAGQLQESLTAAILRLGRTRQDVETVLARLAAADDEKGDAAGGAGAAGAEGAEGDEGAEGIGAAVGPDLAGEGRRLLSGLDELEKTLWWPPETKGIPPETDAWSPVQRAGWFLGSSWEAPTAAERRYLEIAEEATAAALEGYGRFEAERLAPFRARVREARVELLPEEEPLAAP